MLSIRRISVGCGTLLAASALLAGCAATDPVASGRPSGAATTSPATAAIPCAQLQPLAAPITGAFSFSAEDSSEDDTGTTCVWINGAVASTSTALEDYASIGITVDDTAWTPEELATLSGATDDPRAASLGGRILVLGSGTTLGEVGSVQLLSPHGSVTVVATGTLLSASADTRIPVDAVIDVAAKVAALQR